MKLNIYLTQARADVDRADAGAIVIGNEAADLDSMASVILYDLLASACRPLSAPLVVLGVDVYALLFIDDIDLKPLDRVGQLCLTLVDHNIPSADQAQYADAVDAIIDHHRVQGDKNILPQSLRSLTSRTPRFSH